MDEKVIKNTLAFLQRVNLKGQEVDAYQECRNGLIMLLRNFKEHEIEITEEDLANVKES